MYVIFFTTVKLCNFVTEGKFLKAENTEFFFKIFYSKYFILS